MPADAGAAPTTAPADAPSDAPREGGAREKSVSAAPPTAADVGAQPDGPITSATDFAARLADEAAAVRSEVEEIDLLINQAKTESSRHETRRSGAAEKLAMAAERAAAGGNASGKELADLANQLVTVARKAALMEAQIDLLEGKRKSAVRLADLLSAKSDQAKTVAGLPAGGADDGATAGDGGDGGAGTVRASWTSTSAARCRRASPG